MTQSICVNLSAGLHREAEHFQETKPLCLNMEGLLL